MKHGFNPLHAACWMNATECAKLLLAANAAVDQPMVDGCTPLHTACQEHATECAKLLLGAGADPALVGGAPWKAPSPAGYAL